MTNFHLKLSISHHDFWSQTHKVRTYFTEHGHKAWFIDTLICHIASLADCFNLYQCRVLTTTNIIPQQFVVQSDDPMQQQFLQVVRLCLHSRDNHYEAAIGYTPGDESNEEDIEYEEDVIHENLCPSAASTTSKCIDWKKILLLTRKPGTGKTHCVKEAIYQAIDQERSFLVGTPIGFLASTYSATFLEDVNTDTVQVPS
jgi:hypothetical protein